MPSSFTSSSFSPFIIAETELTTALHVNLLRIVFSYLDIEDVIDCGNDPAWPIIKTLRILNEPMDYFPKITFFNQDDWQSHFNFPIDDAPKIDKCSFISQLYLPYKRLESSIEDDAGITILTIPKGLTVNYLISLLPSISVTFATPEPRVSRIQQNCGENVVEKTYTIAVTNNILKNTRDTFFTIGGGQQDIVEKTYKCQVPTVIEILTLMIVYFTLTGKCLYGQDPQTFTRCLEKCEEGYHIRLGNFGKSSQAPQQHTIDMQYEQKGTWDDANKIRNSGIGAVWRFV